MKPLLTAIGSAALPLLFSSCSDTETSTAQLSGAASFAAPTAPSALAVVLAPLGGDGPIDSKILETQQKARSAEAPVPWLERLGALFVHKARVEHDDGAFLLAERCATAIKEIEPSNCEADLLRGHAMQSLHQFAEARTVAEALVEARGEPTDFGLLGDVLVDLGDIDAAADAYQKMLELRPGLQSYARAAHIRWLRGDVGNARKLMELAISAGSARDPESMAWCLSRAARLALFAGDLAVAHAHSDRALQLLEGYGPAHYVAGQIAMARGDAETAVTCFQQAVEQQPLPDHRWAHADALRISGAIEEAQRAEAELVATGQREDPRGLSLYLATRGSDVNRAQQLAERELTQRQDPHSLDARAWALFAGGDMERAAADSAAALASGSVDPRLLYHAGCIAAAQAEPGRARRLFDRAEAAGFALLPSERSDLRRRRSAL